MQRYKRKATGLIVEAAQIGVDDINETAAWSRAFVVEEKDAITGEPSEALNVRTRAGMLRASNGMYVVKIGGEFFVAKEGQFEALYEPWVDPEESDISESDDSLKGWYKANPPRRI